MRIAIYPAPGARHACAVATTIQTRILRRAAGVLGGRRALCEALDVRGDQLSRWIKNEEVPPLRVFMRAVRITVIEDDLSCGPEVAAQRLGRRLTSTLA